MASQQITPAKAHLADIALIGTLCRNRPMIPCMAGQGSASRVFLAALVALEHTAGRACRERQWRAKERRQELVAAEL